MLCAILWLGRIVDAYEESNEHNQQQNAEINQLKHAVVTHHGRKK